MAHIIINLMNHKKLIFFSFSSTNRVNDSNLSASIASSPLFVPFSHISTIALPLFIMTWSLSPWWSTKTIDIKWASYCDCRLIYIFRNHLRIIHFFVLPEVEQMPRQPQHSPGPGQSQHGKKWPPIQKKTATYHHSQIEAVKHLNETKDEVKHIHRELHHTFPAARHGLEKKTQNLECCSKMSWVPSVHFSTSAEL